MGIFLKGTNSLKDETTKHAGDKQDISSRVKHQVSIYGFSNENLFLYDVGFRLRPSLLWIYCLRAVHFFLLLKLDGNRMGVDTG